MSADAGIRKVHDASYFTWTLSVLDVVRAAGQQSKRRPCVTGRFDSFGDPFLALSA